ncbi:hypothetical protein MATL_G00127180 [Megalops atlanticus]|uniref:C2H2-type domain-containing protein n=1 Tax=Megalops atlanticus TaxID=7932 RepID=A0A9D3PUW9_MEGAT|nr:hypothetical protein MATL_G00127180 [Megalops atlanticus]
MQNANCAIHGVGMETESSVYMCFPCYQEFNSLEEVLIHQLTCSSEDERRESSPTAPPDIQAEDHSKTQPVLSLLKPCDLQVQSQNGTSTVLHIPEQPAQASQIQYQCGDCRCLFESLGLWQQHCKLGQCHAPGIGSWGVWRGRGRGREASRRGCGGGAEGRGRRGEGGGEGGTGGREDGGGADGVRRAGGSGVPGSLLPAERCRASGSGGAGEEEAQGKGAESGTIPAATRDGPSAPEKEPDDRQDAPADSEEQDSSSRRRGIRKSKPSAPSVSRQNFLCVDCGAAFSLVPELVSHRKAQHGLEGALHRCLVCGESFLNTTLFLYHRKQHRKRDTDGQGQDGVGEGGEMEVVEGHNPGDAGDTGDTGDAGDTGDGAFENSSPDEQMLEEEAEAGQGTSEAGLGEIQTTPENEVTDSQNSHPGGDGQDSDPNSAADAAAAAPQPQNFLCVDCGSSFSAEPELVEHRKAQHDLKEALHRCSECGESFMNTTLYLYHRRKHRVGDDRGQEGARAGAGHGLDQSASPRGVACLSSPHAATSVAMKRKRSPGLILLHNKLKAENGKGERAFLHKVSEGEDQASAAHPEPLTSPADADPACDPAVDGLPPPSKLSRDWSRTPLPHACPHCGRTFTRRCLLRAHVFTHTGEKLFSCEACGKSFSRPSNLMRHCRTHSAARAFGCKRCGKAFSHPGALKRHQLIHRRAEGDQDGGGTPCRTPAPTATPASPRRRSWRSTGKPTMLLSSPALTVASPSSAENSWISTLSFIKRKSPSPAPSARPSS